MELEIDLSEINALIGNLSRAPQTIQQEFQKTGQAVGFKLQTVAVQEAPVDKGILRANIGPPVTTIGGGATTKLTSHADYSRMVHDGTRPHVIRPSAKKALFWPGADHPTRKVNHPGTAANPYMKRALDKARAQIMQMYADMARNVAQKALSA